jgi:hypothetical protein
MAVARIPFCWGTMVMEMGNRLDHPLLVSVHQQRNHTFPQR